MQIVETGFVLVGFPSREHRVFHEGSRANVSGLRYFLFLKLFQQTFFKAKPNAPNDLNKSMPSHESGFV